MPERWPAGANPYALRTSLERRLFDAHGTCWSKCRPVGREVAALETGAADLLGEKTVLDRMVDVLEKLAVDVAIDRAQAAVRVDLQNGNPGRLRRRHEGRACREQSNEPFHFALLSASTTALNAGLG